METLQRTANRGSVPTGYNIANSCKFEADNSEAMARTNGSEGDKQKCTLSVWVKRTELADGFFFTAGDDADPFFLLGFYQDNLYWSTTAGTSADGVVQTTREFRDTAAWYHIVLAIDTTQGTDTDRYKLYVNGVQETSFSTVNYPAEDANLEIMDDVPQDVGGYTDYFYCGYIAEFVAIDGSQLAPTSFGEVDEDSGIWKPIDVSGLTFGTNGFWLDFEDSSNLGNDKSGGTDFTESNIAAADQATDSPTNNFCILSPLWAFTLATAISEGGTKSVAPGSGGWHSAKGSIAVNNGKWYWEYSGYTAVNTFIGAQNSDISLAYGSAYSVMLSASDDLIYFNDPSNRNEAFSTTIATTDVWAVALNMDDGEISFYRNGSLENSAVALDGLVGQGPFAPLISQYHTNTDMYLNFGGYTADTPSSAASDANGYGAFEYAPPSGYYAICTKNLAEFG